MNKTFVISKKRLLVVFTVLLIVLVFSLLLYGIYIWDNRTGDHPLPSDSSPSTDRAELFVDGKKYTLKENIQSLMFIGIDSYESISSEMYINDRQADFLTLLILDHANKSYSALQINRDTMTRIQTIGLTGENGGSTVAQIALAHAYGTGTKDSSRNTVKAASNLLYGVNIPHYITLPMNSVSVLNDAVGGVSVELLDDFTVLDPAFKKGETVTLKGEQATAYVRYRGELEDSTNIARMARQRQYIAAWMQNLEDAMQKDENFSSRLALDISDDLISDLTVDQLSELSECFMDYEFNGVLEIAGESKQGEKYMEFYVDEDALQKQVLDLFYTPIS